MCIDTEFSYLWRYMLHGRRAVSVIITKELIEFWTSEGVALTDVTNV